MGGRGVRGEACRRREEEEEQGGREACQSRSGKAEREMFVSIS